MARRYAPEVKEAIWALMCEGVKTRVIRERLASGQAGIPTPVEMPRRTLNDTIRVLRERRGEPVRTVNPGGEIEAAGAIRRTLLDVMSREASRLEGISRVRGLTARELEAAGRAAKVTDEIEARLQAPASPPKARAHTSGDDQAGFLAELAGRENVSAEAASGSPDPSSEVPAAPND